MRLGIDASNLRRGGGVTHLVEILRAAQPQEHCFLQVIVWGGATILSRLEDRPWLRKVHEPMLDRALPMRLYWQRFMLNRLARREGCDLLFVPGGSYGGSFRPFVTMSRNMLPFEPSEARRFGVSLMLLKMLALRHLQSGTLRSANGVIFLTQYALQRVLQSLGPLRGATTVIPHGVACDFFCSPRPQDGPGDRSFQDPFRVLYVSIVDMYKHQWNVAEAVAKLRERQFPVQLDLIGYAYPPALKRLRRVLYRIDSAAQFIHYRGPVRYSELSKWYHGADMFVFASSCENMPNTLLEGMAAGLPLACSRMGPMPEVLGDAGIYFDPEDPDDIASALRELVDSPDLRARLAKSSFERAKAFSWQRCASETFGFLAEVASTHSTSSLAT